MGRTGTPGSSELAIICYTKTMNDTTNNPGKQFIGMAIVMFVITAVFCVTLYQYNYNHNTNPQTVAKLNKSVSATAAQNKALTTQNDVLSAKNVQLMDQKAQFCTELSKAKVKDPLCQQ
jgi:cell division protein FtsL